MVATQFLEAVMNTIRLGVAAVFVLCASTFTLAQEDVVLAFASSPIVMKISANEQIFCEITMPAQKKATRDVGILEGSEGSFFFSIDGTFPAQQCVSIYGFVWDS